MKLYTSNFKEVEIDDKVLSHPLNSGECGTIYAYNSNYCIKMYDKEHNEKYNRLQLYVYYVLKTINPDNLVNIKEVYFKSLEAYPLIDGYLATYYKKSKTNILELPSEYLIYNEQQLFNLANLCGDQHIVFHDFKPENAVCTDDKIVIIDPDCWYDNIHITVKEAKEVNISMVLSLLNQLVLCNLKEYDDLLQRKGLYPEGVADKLFPLTNQKKAEGVLTRRLEKCSKAIDYVYKK